MWLYFVRMVVSGRRSSSKPAEGEWSGIALLGGGGGL